MGNCSPKSCTSSTNVSCDKNSPKKNSSSIRVLKDSGSILEFKSPKLAYEVLNSHPGYGIFKQGHGSSPLSENENLVEGKFYYLLPLKSNNTMKAEYIAAADADADKTNKKKMSLSHSASAEFVDNLASGNSGMMQVLPSGGNGVWKVKLMIDTKQLEEILSEQGNTEALIERMRMVASSSSSGPLTPRHSKSKWKSNFSNLFNKDDHS
ncbi:uncharacterized protein LOC115716979 [Cannabis sativa]|uniref:uncharacterized protein LOC115716979 n=1 Tax=Cannabis sativa TaxID=3483 RepID=UPI0029CA8963|nr:uncharacterized protein LOC115716979 [Cannabis sativa]